MNMQCEKCHEQIHEYIDCNLPENQIKSIEKHLKECDDCQAFLDEELNFAELTAKLLEVGTSKFQLKENVKNNIINAVWENKQNAWSSYSFWVKAAAVVFVSIILFSTLSIKKAEIPSTKTSLIEKNSSTTQKTDIISLNPVNPSITKTVPPLKAKKNTNKHKVQLKSICTIYDSVNTNYWIRRNVIVEKPDGKSGFINITVTRKNSG